MATKGNASIAINRELVEGVFGLTACISTAMQEQVPGIKSTANYLSNEDNVGGSVAENFRQCNNAVAAVCDQIMSKTAVISTTMGKYAESLHISFTATQRNSEEQRNKLQGVVAKAKGIGQ